MFAQTFSRDRQCRVRVAGTVGATPRRLQSSIRRRQLNHEAKMLACKGIFARPSIAQTRRRRVEASAVKNCTAILHAHIIPQKTCIVNITYGQHDKCCPYVIYAVKLRIRRKSTLLQSSCSFLKGSEYPVSFVLLSYIIYKNHF